MRMEVKIDFLGLVFISFVASSMLGVGTEKALFDRTGGYCLGLLVMTMLARLGGKYSGANGLPILKKTFFFC